MKEETKIKLVRHSIVKSAISDFWSVAVCFFLIGIGVFLDSSAMQWAGFLMFSLWMIGRTIAFQNNGRMTPQEAANWLYEEFRVVATDESGKRDAA